MGIALRRCGRFRGRGLLRIWHELRAIDRRLGSPWLGLSWVLEGIEYPVSRLIQYRYQHWPRENMNDSRPYEGV